MAGIAQTQARGTPLALGDAAASSSSLAPAASRPDAPRLLAAIEVLTRDVDESVAGLRSRLGALERGQAFTTNLDSGAWHSTLVASLAVPPSEWRTYCGWRFGSRRYQFAPELPAKVQWNRVCDSCLPDRRRELAEAAYVVDGFAHG